MNDQPHADFQPTYGLTAAGAGVLAFAAIDFLLAPLVTHTSNENWLMLLGSALLGTVPAQATLLAAYLVWGPGPFWERLIFHWTIAFLICGAWLLGLWWTLDFGSYDRIVQDETAQLLLVPLGSLALQCPLWISRCFGVRLHHMHSDPRLAPWSIADLLLGTTVLAATLATMLSIDGGFFGRPVAAIATMIAGATVGAVFSLPVCMAMLYLQRKTIRVLAVGLYAALLLGGSNLIVLTTGGAANIGVLPLLLVTACELAGFATLVSCLAIARCYGWRLTTDREVLSTRSASAEPPAA